MSMFVLLVAAFLEVHSGLEVRKFADSLAKIRRAPNNACVPVGWPLNQESEGLRRKLLAAPEAGAH